MPTSTNDKLLIRGQPKNLQDLLCFGSTKASMLAGDVPKCSLKERMQERAALDVRLERIEAGSDCDSDELDALEMRMLNTASQDPSPAHRGTVRESGARTRPNGGDAAPAGGFWSPPKPAVPVRSLFTALHLHCAGGQMTTFWGANELLANVAGRGPEAQHARDSRRNLARRQNLQARAAAQAEPVRNVPSFTEFY
jgi:hypothetical protein